MSPISPTSPSSPLSDPGLDTSPPCAAQGRVAECSKSWRAALHLEQRPLRRCRVRGRPRPVTPHRPTSTPPSTALGRRVHPSRPSRALSVSLTAVQRVDRARDRPPARPPTRSPLSSHSSLTLCLLRTADYTHGTPTMSFSFGAPHPSLARFCSRRAHLALPLAPQAHPPPNPPRPASVRPTQLALFLNMSPRRSS